MTREEFIKVLEEEGYPYVVDEKDNLVVGARNMSDTIDLGFITSLPPRVIFVNQKDLHLGSLEAIPTGVKFHNKGTVFLDRVKTISVGVEFHNVKVVYLYTAMDGRFNKWKGNIEGIASNRLLNGMIKGGMFI